MPGTSLKVQWLRLCASNEEGAGLIPGQGTKIPQATGHSQKTPKKTEFKIQQDLYLELGILLVPLDIPVE